MTKRICPECGSDNTDCPRAYDMKLPSPRFMYCSPVCLDCGHEGERYQDVHAAFAAWEADNG